VLPAYSDEKIDLLLVLRGLFQTGAVLNARRGASVAFLVNATDGARWRQYVDRNHLPPIIWLW
jgi:hypothetical protein